MSGNLSNRITSKAITISSVSESILSKAYQDLYMWKEYDLDWDEEQFSAVLTALMRDTSLASRFNFVIDIEIKLIEKGKNPKKYHRIDIRFASWKFSKKYQQCFFEAKNLYEQNHKKIHRKTQVNAKKYIERYVLTGIDSLISGKYEKCSMLGYLVNADCTKITDQINMHLIGRGDTKTPLVAIANKLFSNYYESVHLGYTGEIKIKHIFLKFD